jgi:hypothetical protein
MYARHTKPSNALCGWALLVPTGGSAGGEGGLSQSRNNYFLNM